MGFLDSFTYIGSGQQIRVEYASIIVDAGQVDESPAARYRLCSTLADLLAKGIDAGYHSGFKHGKAAAEAEAQLNPAGLTPGT
jgi:hypothetical protein